MERIEGDKGSGVGGVSGSAQERTGKKRHRIAQPASARAISHSTNTSRSHTSAQSVPVRVLVLYHSR